MSFNSTTFLSHQPSSYSQYGYTPTTSVCIIILSLFGISTLLHVAQAIWFRMWFLLPTAALAGLTEVIGWTGRLWSSLNTTEVKPFEMQISCTIIAPSFLVAANFIVLGRIIQRLGPRYSRLNPWRYAIIFCSFDVISLVVQAVGGGMASVAAGNGRNPAPGGHLMLGGIAFQLVTIVIYALLAAEFFVRYFNDKPILHSKMLSERYDDPSTDRSVSADQRLLLMIIALVFNTTCLFIRAVYRVVELAGGWRGHVIRTQIFFNVCDGAMIILAIYTLNIAHPGFLLRPTHQTAKV